ncbi:Beta-glucosidase/6-phospho-beta-glucosidase/beta-galactosidase [Roseomonas rosea]|uniref:Beta-glucosidase/6-phospho-beta-glucosidase/beta-galactosidase n=1 Tax=Muricoccus roseus TaxID=198092 RepID=A0A1M6PH15_9PROT|nr:beta-glucosidase [Roseomonas rosea]SHK07246.1 Beta-glucosidase/6-phospho-beta-glucosidase/beta-galactosidase [Roseomonas rosea]
MQNSPDDARTDLAPVQESSPGASGSGPELGFRPSLFRSFFLGGFECSTHRRRDGRRLDLIRGTRHDVLITQDYRQLADMGIRSVRDGVRWHLVETTPGHYDWCSVLPALRAARETGTQVAWDLCHYGWPDGLDVYSSAFVDRFAAFSAAFARLHLAETGEAPMVCPVNEISFFSWAGGEAGLMNPGHTDREHSDELKRQLVRATLAGTRAVREAAPAARILAIDPIINIVARPGEDPAEAEARNEGQFHAWDMIAGRMSPELGGAPEMLDILGVNYYWNNQWLHGGLREPLLPGDARHKPLRDLLAGAHARYGRPIFMAETSIEGDERAPWFRYVGEEVRAAMRAGVPMEGICFYPVLSHPGWDDDRYCPNGLLELREEGDIRPVHEPLAAELAGQRRLFHALCGAR